MTVITRVVQMATVGLIYGALAASSASATTIVPRSDETLDRVALSHRAWNQTTDTYDRAYVYPTSWSLRLNGCGTLVDGAPVNPNSVSQPDIYWHFEPLGSQPVEPFNVRSRGSDGNRKCDPTATLPALGRWRVTVSVFLPDASAVATHESTFRDVVVAAVGDSFTSGEGNRLGNWTDEQCHRSYGSWAEYLAERLETGTTAVTFLNLACSGTRIANLANSVYGGIIPDAAGGRHQLDPQLRAMRGMLGDPLAPETRTVDVLLGSAGINDLASGAGALLEGCALFGGTCQMDLTRDIARLKDSYASLELAISRNIRLGHAYFLGYPARIFTNAVDEFSGCGVFNMSRGDAEWIHGTVQSVNRELTKAATRWGWTVLPTTELFRRHGYCADVVPLQRPDIEPGTPWFRAYLATKREQGDKYGTAHPNQGGHTATARVAAQTVGTDAVAPGPDVFDIRLLRVRVTDELNVPWPGTLEFGVAPQMRSGCGHATESVTGLRLRVWNDLSNDPCQRFHVRTAGRTVAVFARTHLNPPARHDDEPPQDQQQGRGQRTPVRPGPVSLYFERFLQRGQGWGAIGPPGPGHVIQHFVTAHDKGRLELEYEITRPVVVAPTS
jgi:hypothetical protein